MPLPLRPKMEIMAALLLSLMLVVVYCDEICHPKCVCSSFRGVLSCSNLENKDLIEMRHSSEYGWVKMIILRESHSLDLRNADLFPYLEQIDSGKH